jgi:hypothetical protein
LSLTERTSARRPRSRIDSGRLEACIGRRAL